MSDLVRVCAWCDKGIEREVSEEEMRELQEENRLTHGMCLECREVFEEDTKEFKVDKPI